MIFTRGFQWNDPRQLRLKLGGQSYIRPNTFYYCSMLAVIIAINPVVAHAEKQ